MKPTTTVLPIGLVLALCLFTHLAPARADSYVSPVPTVGEFALYKANPADGGSFNQSADSYLGCVTSYMQYLCAAQSYGAGWPTSSDGLLTHSYDSTWLTPQTNPAAITGTVNVGGTDYPMYSWAPNALQFYLGWAALDHNTANPNYLTSPKGYNLGTLMNQQQRYWDNASGTVKIVPASQTIYNNVQIDYTVLGSSLSPTVVASDTFTVGNPQDFITPGATAEFHSTGLNTFSGNWSYSNNVTDGGVLGNLAPAGATPMIIKIDLVKLGNHDGNDIQNLIFYDFTHPAGNYDPNNPLSYLNQSYIRLDLNALGVGEGDSIYLVSYPGCCTLVPEPLTLLLLATGGAGVVATGLRRYLRKKKIA